MYKVHKKCVPVSENLVLDKDKRRILPIFFFTFYLLDWHYAGIALVLRIFGVLTLIRVSSYSLLSHCLCQYFLLCALFCTDRI